MGFAHQHRKQFFPTTWNLKLGRGLHPLTSALVLVDSDVAALPVVLVDEATLGPVMLSEMAGELLAGEVLIAATTIEGAMVAAIKRYIFFESMTVAVAGSLVGGQEL